MNRARLHARIRRRQQQRGTILMIVALTLALLGAMGVYAMSSATTEIRSSGYARQASQAHYITQLGNLAMIDAFSPANASFFDAQMRASATFNDEASRCQSSVPREANNVTAMSKSCAKVPQNYFTTAWGQNEVIKNDSLSPIEGTLSGSFTSEITEPITGGVRAGYDTNNGKCFRRYTITTYGQLQTVGAAAPLAREIGRSRVTAGPFDCGG